MIKWILGEKSLVDLARFEPPTLRIRIWRLTDWATEAWRNPRKKCGSSFGLANYWVSLLRSKRQTFPFLSQDNIINRSRKPKVWTSEHQNALSIIGGLILVGFSLRIPISSHLSIGKVCECTLYQPVGNENVGRKDDQNEFPRISGSFLDIIFFILVSVCRRNDFWDDTWFRLRKLQWNQDPKWSFQGLKSHSLHAYHHSRSKVEG